MKRLNKIIYTLLIIIITLPVIYYVGGYTVIDKFIIQSIDKDLTELSINNKDDEFKEEVVKEDLNKIKTKLNLIKDKTTKTNYLKDKVEVLNNLTLYIETRDSIRRAYITTNYSNLDVDIDKLLEQTFYIKNQKQRQELLKKGNIIKDRQLLVDKFTSSYNELLKDKNLPNFYKTEVLLEPIIYTDLQEKYHKELSKIYNEIEQKQKTEEEQKARIESIRNQEDQLYTPTVGNSLVTYYEPYEYSAKFVYHLNRYTLTFNNNVLLLMDSGTIIHQDNYQQNTIIGENILGTIQEINDVNGEGVITRSYIKIANFNIGIDVNDMELNLVVTPLMYDYLKQLTGVPILIFL